MWPSTVQSSTWTLTLSLGFPYHIIYIQIFRFKLENAYFPSMLAHALQGTDATTIVDSQGIYGRKPLWGTKRKRLKKTGKAFRMACTSDFCGTRKKGRRVNRKSHSAAQLYKASARPIKSLKEVTHEESCPLQEFVCQRRIWKAAVGPSIILHSRFEWYVCMAFRPCRPTGSNLSHFQSAHNCWEANVYIEHYTKV